MTIAKLRAVQIVLGTTAIGLSVWLIVFGREAFHNVIGWILLVQNLFMLWSTTWGRD